MTTANAAGICLRALGGTGQGIIGALGSVGLRAGGNEGRFLDLPGLRELGERARLAELERIGLGVHYETAVVAGANAEGQHAPAERQDGMFLTMNWVRPRLVGGRAVWPVRWSSRH